MIKRIIEDKDYLRACVEHIKLQEVKDNSLLFKTFSTVTQKKQISSADSQMVEQRNISPAGSLVCGRLQLDVCAPNVLRIRYKQGDEIAANDTPMVVGGFKSSEHLDVEQQERKIIVKTESAIVTINTKPYSISIVDTKRDSEINISGGEKNYFRDWDAVGTGICYGLKDVTSIATENFSLQHDECIYGFGEKFIKLNKVGQTIDLNMCDALGVSSSRSYKNIPFYVSTNGYGVFFNHSSLMTFWVGSMSACDIQVGIQDDFLDYYVFLGDIKEILQAYTTLTGKGQLPPKWTFGYWQSKISYSSAEETLEIVKNMRENQIPCDVIHLDTNWFKQNWYCDLEFNKENFPDPEVYFKTIEDMGVKVSLWQLPYIPEGSELFHNLKAVDGFVKDKNGEIYDVKICFTKGFKGVVGLIDFTNPKAVEIYCVMLKRLFKLGARAIKTDFGEAAPLDGVYHNGALAHQMHNLYPLIYNKTVFELTQEETGGGVVWARSAWARLSENQIHLKIRTNNHYIKNRF